MKLPGGAIPGILCMLIAVGLWTSHDAASKWLAAGYPVLVVLFWRNVFAMIPAGLFVARAGRLQPLPPRLLMICWLRGIGGGFAYGTFVFALPLLPLADAAAVAQVGPILIIVLSGWLLKERLDRASWIAVIIAFAATLFIVRPGGDIPLLAAVLLLGGTILYAFMMVLTRHIGALVDGTTLNWHASCATLATMALGTPIVFAWPAMGDLPLFMLVGLITGLANFFMIQAFRLAPAPTVAPFEYSAVLWAVLLGLLIWGDIPSWSVIGGASVIVASGIYLMRREGMTRGKI
ncbi:MAG: DMT family transporter [Alphaproteobacteria bacterium]